MTPPRIASVNRIVVRGTNWVGDAVMTVPALRELRRLFPKAHITLATRSWAKGLFQEADFVDEIMVCDQSGPWSVFQQAREWRARKFDLAVLFTNSFETALITALARVPYRVGYATEGRSWLLTRPVALPDWRSSRHEVYYYLNLVAEVQRWLGLEPEAVAAVDCSLNIAAEAREQARKLITVDGANEGLPIVALCPGSINSRAKRWPAERYAAVGDLIIEELNANVLIIGSPDELDVSLEVKKRMTNSPVVLTGKTSLDQLVGVLSEVDLLITNDTGPAHIASAVGTPTLVIFGPTNPLTTRPFSDNAQLLRHPPDCAPCMLRDCPIDHRCMTAITPEEVLQRARTMLEAERKRPEGQEYETTGCVHGSRRDDF